VRTHTLRMKSTQSFIHEAPDELQHSRSFVEVQLHMMEVQPEEHCSNQA